MKSRKYHTLYFFLILFAFSAACSSFKKSGSISGDNEINDLIAAMSIEEKVGQMTQLNLDVVCVGEIYNLSEPHRLDMVKLRSALVDWHVGSILNCGGHAYPREQWLELISGIQKVAEEETRLKIPVLYGIDAIHGANYVSGSTLFPQQLAQAATFNPQLTLKASEITAYETRAAGIPWNFSPVLDVGRNPLWSRFFETYGEDPLVCTRFGDAAIQGYQGKQNEPTIDGVHVAACMKHFLGYGGSRTGKDRTPAYISDIQLRELYIPSFQKAIQDGALTVMINSGEINGIPVHADKKILTGLLRDELKFEGVAVTDWEDVIKLQVNHRVAASLKEAVEMAVDAGIDMCMVPNDFNFSKYLIELVKEGKISESRLNISVERILKLKKKLGILKHATVPSAKDFALFGSKEHAQFSKNTAIESITLLKNEKGILPLKKEQRVLITGPAANSMSMLNGAWTRTWQGVESKYDDTSKNTIYESLMLMHPDLIKLSNGCDLDQIVGLEETLMMSEQSDVIVACLGELPSTEKPGDIDDLELSAAQQQFIHALAKKGKPIVLVLLENRPRIIREIADECAAIVMAYQPGDFGGEALADILYGIANPSGKLPFTYPKYNNSLIWYDHKHTEDIDQTFGNNAFQPQWPFGFGMSYSDITYSDLILSKADMSSGEKITVKCTVKNNSNREAKESVLLFIHDEYASVTPAVRRLKDFTKITLAPNSEQEVTFTLDEKMLQFIGRDLQPIVESGDFELIIGNHSTTLHFQNK